MSNEIQLAIEQICEEKNISYDLVIETIQAAMAAAYRKDFGQKDQHIRTEFDVETGKIKAFDVKEIVENYELNEEGNVVAIILEDGTKKAVNIPKTEEELAALAAAELSMTPEMAERIAEEETKIIRFNPINQIMLKDAQAIDKKLQVGEEVVTALEIPGEFGRVAALTAKQVIIQKIRELERGALMTEFADKEGMIVLAQVLRKEGKNVIIDLGKTTGILLPTEQLLKDQYIPGERMKFYVIKVEPHTKGVNIYLSRRHSDLVIDLFNNEVPEISAGTIEIKAIAREAGSRSKVAVASNDPKIDALGSCVGQGGVRVQTIIHELGGEKIDIVEFSSNMNTYMSSALSPAKIEKIVLNEEHKSADIYVHPEQLSLAIGKGGQNVRLSSRLIGWKLNIISTEGKTIEELFPQSSAPTTKETPVEEVKKEETSETATPAQEETPNQE